MGTASFFPGQQPDFAVEVPFLRKLRGNMLRLMYRALHGRPYRHSARLWRDLRIQRNAAGQIAACWYRGTPLPLWNGAPYPGAALLRPGSRAHLIASGPSIAAIDYRQLSMEHVIGVNGAIALQDTQPVRFEYYCIIDTNFVRQRMDLVARIVSADLTLFVTPLVLWFILQRMPLSAVRCRLCLIEDLREPSFLPALSNEAIHTLASDDETHCLCQFDRHAGLGYSFDLARGFFDVGTVAYVALQILTWLGYRSIYLHGLDLRNAASTPRFYETAENMQPSGLDHAFANRIEPSFFHAAQLLRARGIVVSNLSPDSALSEAVFPKLDWRMLVGTTRISRTSRTRRTSRVNDTGTPLENAVASGAPSGVTSGATSRPTQVLRELAY